MFSAIKSPPSVSAAQGFAGARDASQSPPIRALRRAAAVPVHQLRRDKRYSIKRDAQGNAVRALAVDPMPDFAYRNERWVCAPVAADTAKTVPFTEAIESRVRTRRWPRRCFAAWTMRSPRWR
jgi:hypothetical protein